jgi:hypothetical protein
MKPAAHIYLETTMGQQQQPSKEQIRQYMESRQAQQCPPPSMPEIRRQLGWGLIAANEMAPDAQEQLVSVT